ncbi:MAG: hypothetical protein AAF745_18685 [Planctomycetota bacterium]
MEWLGNVLNFLHPSVQDSADFRWRQSGMGTHYLLITCSDRQPEIQIFGTREISSLLDELSAVANLRDECVLIGVEAWEVTSRFFRLDPQEAIEKFSGV